VQTENYDNNVNLIQTLINIPLAFGSASEGSTAVMDASLQTSLQQFILVVSMLCIPVMLIAKPVILLYKKEHHHFTIGSI